VDRSYTEAMTQPCDDDDTVAVIRLNRALAHLREGGFEAALKDALTDCLSSSTDTHEKALYRASQALYRLGRYNDCYNVVKSFCVEYPQNLLGSAQLRRIAKRIEEIRSGTYDYAAIYKALYNSKSPQMDHATFVGPIFIKPSPGRGDGTFTNRAVAAGELLLCEKAFAYRYEEAECSEMLPSDGKLLMSSESGKITMGTQSDLIVEIVHKLKRNPSLATDFFKLNAGSHKPTERADSDGNPIVDT